MKTFYDAASKASRLLEGATCLAAELGEMAKLDLPIEQKMSAKAAYGRMNVIVKELEHCIECLPKDIGGRFDGNGQGSLF